MIRKKTFIYGPASNQIREFLIQAELLWASLNYFEKVGNYFDSESRKIPYDSNDMSVLTVSFLAAGHWNATLQKISFDFRNEDYIKEISKISL